MRHLPLIFIAILSASCTDKGKISETRSKEHVVALAEVVRTDVRELADGLPKGAERAYKAFFEDIASPKQDPFTTQRALELVHTKTPELRYVKASFYALLDPDGTAVRNNMKVDVMAGKKLFQLFPPLASGNERLRTATGSFDTEDRPERPSRTYVAVSGIHAPNGELKGFLAAGWSYGSFAKHLGETARMRIRESVLRGENKEKEPVLYVACFDESGIYPESDMPKVTAEELGKQLSTVGQTPSASGRMNVEGRDFAWASQKVGEWGPTQGIAVARTEL